MKSLPTSDLDTYKQMLLAPNTAFPVPEQKSKIMKIQKNLVISYMSDSTGCGHIRNIFPMSYLNAIFGKTGKFNLVLSPIMLFQHDILLRTRSIFFQRTMAPQQIPAIKQYKQLQARYGFKMVWDIDDFIWKGDDVGEAIPQYNFGHKNIKDETRKASIEIANMMDICCVSTPFLKEYMETHGCTSEIRVVPNAVNQFFWGPIKKQKAIKKFTKPKVIYTGSPTHYSNEEKLKGDWDNAWLEWVLKSVRENKIDFTVMGGLPWFFESIKDKIKVVNWVNSFTYHLPIKDLQPDFGIAPLVPNYFNYSKSDIKHIEYCAIGALSIGSTFTNGKPSPYDNNLVTLPDNCTVDDIQAVFDKYTEPKAYNDIIARQFKMLDNDGRYTESPKFIKTMTDIF